MVETIHESSTTDMTDVRPSGRAGQRAAGHRAVAGWPRGTPLQTLPTFAGRPRDGSPGPETIAAMEEIEMIPTRSSLNREDVQALLDECAP